MDTHINEASTKYDFFAPAGEQLYRQTGVGAGDSSVEFVPYPQNKKVLEIGFGKGHLIRKLLENNNEVWGVDIGHGSHTHARDNGFYEKAKLLWMDVCHDYLPILEDYIDEAYCLECIEHLENPHKMFKEVKRVLKNKGRFIVAFPRPEDNLGTESGDHWHQYPGFLLKKSFRCFCDTMYFRVLKYRENGSSAWYLLENVKEGKEIGTHELIQGNYDYNEIFGHLHDLSAWQERNDPMYIYKLNQAINLVEGAKFLP